MVDYQNYVGTSAPSPLMAVRHYDMRGGSNMADIQVNLLHKEDRDLQKPRHCQKKLGSHVQRIGRKYGANVKIVEVPGASCFVYFGG